MSNDSKSKQKELSQSGTQWLKNKPKRLYTDLCTLRYGPPCILNTGSLSRLAKTTALWWYTMVLSLTSRTSNSFW